jgi:hypothetical protein
MKRIDSLPNLSRRWNAECEKPNHKLKEQAEPRKTLKKMRGKYTK